MKSGRSDLIGGAGWMVFGAAICAFAWTMDRFDSMGATLYTMPGFMPGLIGATLIVLGAALAWRGWRRAAPAAASAPLFDRRVVAMLALCLAYAGGLVGRVPFWLATAVFVAAFTALYSDRPAKRRALVALIAGAATSATVVLVFEQVFLVRLP